MHTQMGDHTLSPVRLTAGLGLMPLARPLSSKPTSSSYQLYLKRCVSFRHRSVPYILKRLRATDFKPSAIPRNFTETRH